MESKKNEIEQWINDLYYAPKKPSHATYFIPTQLEYLYTEAFVKEGIIIKKPNNEQTIQDN